MFYFVLFLIVNMNLLVHSNIYLNKNFNIEMKLSNLTMNGNGYGIEKHFKVLRDKSFTITVIKFTAAGVKCKAIKTDNNFETKFKLAHGNTIITVTTATVDMTEKWQCSISRKGNEDLKLTFYIRVIGDPKKVHMEIAGKELKTTLANSSELAYDEYAEYYFEEGETIQFVCQNKKSQENFHSLYLHYYDSQETKLIETGRISNNKTAFFQKTMKSTDNNHKIDCINEFETRDKTKMLFPHRVIFKLTNTSRNSDLNITINDIKLRPINTKNGKSYNFRYFPNQLLRVSCETSNKNHGSIHIVNKPSKFKDIRSTPWHETVQFHTKSINDSYKLGVENSPRHVLDADILLIKSEVPEILILGLDAKNVIDQYTWDSKTWIIDYRYSVGNTLYLSCTTRDRRFLQWVFGTPVIQDKESKMISYNFTLSEEHNESLIVCEDVRDTDHETIKAIINLHMKSTSYFAPDDPYNTSHELSEDDDKMNHISDDTILIACTMVVFMLAVMGLGLFFYFCRYRTSKRLQISNHTVITNNAVPTPIYATPIEISKPDQNLQEYMVPNSLYNENDNAEYQYVDINYISKGNIASSRPDSLKVDNLYANSLTQRVAKERDKNNIGTNFVPFNTHYDNIIRKGESSQSPYKNIYDETYSMNYINIKNNGM